MARLLGAQKAQTRLSITGCGGGLWLSGTKINLVKKCIEYERVKNPEPRPTRSYSKNALVIWMLKNGKNPARNRIDVVYFHQCCVSFACLCCAAPRRASFRAIKFIILLTIHLFTLIRLEVYWT